MFLSKVALGLFSLVTVVLAANKTAAGSSAGNSSDIAPIEDLGTVLATHNNLTEYYKLIQVLPSPWQFLVHANMLLEISRGFDGTP